MSLVRWVWSIKYVWNGVRYLDQVSKEIWINLILRLLFTVIEVPCELSVLAVLVSLLLALLMVHGVSWVMVEVVMLMKLMMKRRVRVVSVWSDIVLREANWRLKNIHSKSFILVVVRSLHLLSHEFSLLLDGSLCCRVSIQWELRNLSIRGWH